MTAKKPAKTVDPAPASPRGPNPKEVVEKVSKKNGLTNTSKSKPKK